MIKKFQIFEAIKWYSKGKWEEGEETETKYHDDITDDGFREFLLDNDAYEGYLRNRNRDVSKSPRSDYINNAFTWINTPEKDGFWSKLHDKWNREMNNDKYHIFYINRYNIKKGDRVRCIKDTVNNNKHYIKRIKEGEIKTIKGFGENILWFTDTPGGYGGYPYEDFVFYQ
jgi:hypothetical protein